MVRSHRPPCWPQKHRSHRKEFNNSVHSVLQWLKEEWRLMIENHFFLTHAPFRAHTPTPPKNVAQKSNC